MLVFKKTKIETKMSEREHNRKITWAGLSEGISRIASLTSNDERQDAFVSGVEYDSRRVTAGSVFVAMRGGSSDGNRYIDAAISQGASGIITDSPDAFAQLSIYHSAVPSLFVEHGRGALAQAAANFYDHPEKKLRSTGITGTNGKTTTAFLTEALLNAGSRSTILVGTIEYHIAGSIRPSAHTTPESRDLFELMAEGSSLGATELVMEVSSHALDQGRVAGVGCDVAVFTNLTRDHLDYHGSMESYFASKRLLFDGQRYPAPRLAVLNVGDSYFNELAKSARQAGSKIVTYGLDTTLVTDWRAEELKLTASGAQFRLVSPSGAARVESHLAGEVNVLNLLASLAAAHARDVPFETLTAAIPNLRPVPGRFESVDAAQPFTVIVDYAHTDDALRNLTSLGQQLTQTKAAGRVITVFGCGGDRDRTKRPKMGQAAGEGSDFVVVTSDNPRSEDPNAIITEILPGLIATGVRYAVEPDRASAIHLALSEARPGDIVLLAGKGHEKTQTLSSGTIDFDDAEIALSALHSLGYGDSK